MKVKFLPSDIELEMEPNLSVMELAHKHGIFIKSVCNGVPNCAECRVKIVEGEYNVLPPSSKELALIGSGHFIDQRRLSCQLYCFGDVVIDLSEQQKKEHEGPPGSRRFQLDLRSEGIVSKAVTGNLIQQDKDIVEALSESGDLIDSDPVASGRRKERGRDRQKSSTRPPAGGDSKSRLESLMMERGEDFRQSDERSRKSQRSHRSNRMNGDGHPDRHSHPGGSSDQSKSKRRRRRRR